MNSVEKYGFVYVWRDAKRNMYYVGCHWGVESDGYICSSTRMRNAYTRRKEDFKRRVVARINTNRQDLLIEEHKWLSQIKDEQLGKKFYNMSKKHFGHWTSTERAEEIRQKMSGRKWSDESRAKMKGNKNGAGKVCSEEKKRKISQAQKGRVHKSEEQNKAHSEFMKGRPAWNKGKKVWSEEDKLRISQQTKGRKMSPESSEKKRLAMQAYFERKKAAKK